MKRLSKYVVIGCLISLLLTGCWSKKELDQIALVTGIGIDKKGDEYNYTVQIINPGEVTAKQMTTRTAVSTYTSTGRSIFEAIREMTKITPRMGYYSHTRKVVFGEELAKEGIGKALDLLARDHEFRTDFHIAVAKDIEAADILKVLTPLEKVPANKMYTSMQISEDNWAPTKTVKIQELINSIISKGKEPVLTGVYLTSTADIGSHVQNVEQVASPANVIIDNIGVFKGDKLIGWLNTPQSKGFNYITNNVSGTAEYMPCGEDGNVTVEVINSESKIKATVNNNQPHITINVKVKGDIDDVQCKELDLSKEKSLNTVERKLEKRLNSAMEEAINITQTEFNSDIFGFGEYVHRADKTYWKSVKDNWDAEYKNLTFQVNTNVNIVRTGTITDSFQKEVEEGS
ncbi:Ger(x)C family spore germination protein [Pontibacillus yanchengensis]|uniref:Spore gernimation protein GerC n=1 Tax=Pontibacillus yanchengensis Y32 TaxID=1385514 RepID=A0A0A2T8Z5_9BACI|nr:Ger(x)C family spore germination protein [Pontibacillus yanchengensis]KGP70848.1 spore gernimation protein GerC [Pontibacillus yanchengensis Y32]